MELPIYTVDAFSSEPFSGNPAAVIPLDKPLSEEALQKVASEINLSETAYLILPSSSASSPSSGWKDGHKFGLRWFTPTNEVNLCGHATLAAAHVLFQCLGNTSEQLHFDTLSGVMIARRNTLGNGIILDFPSHPPKQLTAEHQQQLGPVVAAVAGSLPISEVMLSTTAKKLLVRLDDSCTRKQLESLRPDTQKLLSLHDGSLAKGVIVTIRGHRSIQGPSPNADHNDDFKEEPNDDLKDYHFVSRYFAPWNGIPEDPVTGSAHTVLGPYWADKLQVGHTRPTPRLIARQCSPRGGVVGVVVRGDGRVDLDGEAVTLIRGTITV